MKINKNLLILHITVVVWGFTGILGSLISISALQLVWYRVLIAFLSLFVYFKFSGKSISVHANDLFKFLFVGGLVGLHWFLFFWSIKLSTVSVTLVCLSSLTLFTALLEPLFTKEKIARLDLSIGLIIISGIYLIFKFETQYIAGIMAGLGAALMGSLFSILNSRLVKTTEASTISFYEMLGAWLWLSLFLLMTGGFDASSMQMTLMDFFYLLLLGTVCTSVAYVAGVAVMRELSAFRVALTTNLEPVYGIVLAWIIFGKKEEMSLGFYIGAGIVLAAVFFYPYLKARKYKTEKV
ncbi:DMT family transporter [Olivibacter sitiensis]|uniref:DMT family transporter n=1 Tax=Olivibacter sitiensis TaxID=376470 RepID=UPI0004014DA4|nr:DMT family transporter [Olivibacter sitiensis]